MDCGIEMVWITCPGLNYVLYDNVARKKCRGRETGGGGAHGPNGEMGS